MNIGYETDTENIKKQALLDLLKDMPIQTLSIAYLYAKNYNEYGKDYTFSQEEVLNILERYEIKYRNMVIPATERKTDN